MNIGKTKRLGIIFLLIVFALSISACDMMDDFTGGEATVTRTGSISGNIIDEYENSLNGVQVTVGDKTDSTNIGGSYFIEDLEVGDYTLTAILEGYEEKSVQVTVEDGSNSIETIQMVREDGTTTGDVEGEIVDENEDPLEGVEVTVNNKTDETENDGTFLIKDVEVGEHKLTATFDGYQDKSTEVKIEEDLNDVGQLQLEPGKFYSVSSVEELEETLDNLKEEDEAKIFLETGTYEKNIRIDDKYQFTELTLAAEEEYEAKIPKGINIRDTNDVTIVGMKIICEGERERVTMGIWNSKNITLENNYIENAGLYVTGIIEEEEVKPGTGSKEINIFNNEIAESGIGIQGTESDAHVEGNTISNSEEGIAVEAAEVIVEDNEIKNNESRGVVLRGPWWLDEDTDMELEQNDVIIRGNIINKNDQYGIEIAGDEETNEYLNAEIVNNEISYNNSSAISSTSGDIYVAENEITNHSTFPLLAENSKVNIQDNDLEDNILGLYFVDTVKGDFTVENNNFSAADFDIEETWLKETETCDNLDETERLYIMSPDEDVQDKLEYIKSENDFCSSPQIYSYFYDWNNGGEWQGYVLGSKGD